MTLLNPSPVPPRAEEAAAPTHPSLVIDGVTKSWGRGDSRITVLDDVALRLDPGTLTWVGGRNGVGKTTLLRIAAGMITPEKGRVSLRGLDPAKDRRAYQRRIGFLTAGDRGLYPRLTVRRNLDFWARISFIPKERRRPIIASTLERFELIGLSERWASRLSLGQRQRLRLALTLMHEPELLLLDEPRNSLDVEGNALLAAEIERLLRRGGSAVWCSPAGEDLGIEFDAMCEIVDGQLKPA